MEEWTTVGSGYFMRSYRKDGGLRDQAGARAVLDQPAPHGVTSPGQ